MPRPIVPRQTLHYDALTGESYLVDRDNNRGADMSINAFSGGGLDIIGRNLIDLQNGRIITRVGGSQTLQFSTTESGHIGIFNAVSQNALDARGSRTGMVGINGSIDLTLSNGDVVPWNVDFASVTRLGSSALMHQTGPDTWERYHIAYTGETQQQLQSRLGTEYRYATKTELLLGGVYSYARRHGTDLFNAISRAGGIDGKIDPLDSDSKMAWALAQMMVNQLNVMTSYLWSAS